MHSFFFTLLHFNISLSCRTGLLRNGTEYEFSALLNCLPDMGGPFYEDEEAFKEIVQITKHRLANAQDYDNLMAGVKGGFGGELFDIFQET